MFDYFRYVKTVYDCQSFSKAADKLCITQPALSIAISKAEEELGCRLFDRRVKPLKITDEGRLYLETANKVLKIESEMKERLSGKTVIGELKIGAAAIAMNYILPDILDIFRKRYSTVDTFLFEESAFTLKDQLKNGNIDLVVDTEINDSEIESIPLFSNYILYAVSENLLSKELIDLSFNVDDIVDNSFLANSQKRVDFNCLKHIPYLSLQPRNELYLRAESYFTYYHCRPDTVMNFNQQLTSYRFAHRGYGGAFVGDTLVKACPLERLRFFVMDAQTESRKVCISYRKNSYLSGAMSAFIALAEEMYGTKQVEENKNFQK